MDNVGRILMVEDDPKDVELTITALQEYNLANEVVVTKDGEEALDYLYCRGKYASRPSDLPAVLLLDLKLPKVDGLQVLREIKAKAETRAIPVIALTSSKEESDLLECYHLGVNSYIQKPVDFEKFRETIRAVRVYWATINQSPPQRAFAPR